MRCGKKTRLLGRCGPDLVGDIIVFTDMSNKKVSDIVAEFIADLKVRHVFMISGGGNMHLIDSVGKNPNIKYICNHHEQACAISAEAYARGNDNFGVCLVTTGPGSTNALTGVIGAWLDSIPTLYISGQVKKTDLGQLDGLRALGVQEVNTVDMAKPVTKYADIVLEPNKIKFYLEKAAFMARSGRPGPSWLDIPLDVQSAMVDEGSLESFDPIKEGIESKPTTDNLNNLVRRVVEMIQTAKRPVIIAGHGIRLAHARKEFEKLIEILQIPILTAMSAHDLITSSNPLFVGRHGGFGDRAGNFAVQNSDLILSIGSRNHLWNIGYQHELFAREAKKIVVDIDEKELNKKTLKPDLPILADARDFMSELISQSGDTKFADISDWRKKCLNWKNRYPVLTEEYKKQDKYVNSYYFTDVLSDLMREGEQVVLADGTAFTGTLQGIKIKKDQRVYYNVGCASMGWCLPAAIGVAFAKESERVVLITGDGSIMMNLQELQTIKHHNLPIKIFLLNNNGYLAIKNTQNSFFQGNLIASSPESGVSFPDFKKVSDAFGIAYEKMTIHSEVKDTIERVLSIPGPVICEILMDPSQTLYPRITSLKMDDGTMVSKPLEDMYPFLDRKEFLDNMIVKPINP